MQLLLVEDDVRVSDFIRRGLNAEGFCVNTAENGETGIDLATHGEYDLIILDLMLPDIDGREVCRMLRAAQVQTPLLMLTALDAVEQKVEGLRAGADDYLTKPFSFDELLARIDALLRRPRELEEKMPVIEIGDLEIHWRTREVRRQGRRIDLTPTEFSLLVFLARRPGAVFSKSRILENVWGQSRDPGTNVVEVYIRHLRRKVDDPFDRPLIHTVRGFGYKLESFPTEKSE